jgi:hypothetical protein
MILWPFGYLVAIWYIFHRFGFGILNEEKYGNLEANWIRIHRYM